MLIRIGVRVAWGWGGHSCGDVRLDLTKMWRRGGLREQ